MSDTTTNPSAADVKHTPGPWEAEEHELSEGYVWVVYDGRGEMVADRLTEPQARLIVHCVNNFPDLLDALRGLLEYSDEQGGSRNSEEAGIRNAARAALAKAGAL